MAIPNSEEVNAPLPTIGERLSAWLADMKITPNRAAQITGISRSNWYQWVGEKQSIPQIDSLLRLLQVWPDLNQDWLLTGMGPMRKGAESPEHSPIEKVNQESRSDKSLRWAQTYQSLQSKIDTVGVTERVLMLPQVIELIKEIHEDTEALERELETFQNLIRQESARNPGFWL
ncbi:MAG: helix-turn-helix transcriptional regulator [Bacteroidota bacterium]